MSLVRTLALVWTVPLMSVAKMSIQQWCYDGYPNGQDGRCRCVEWSSSPFTSTGGGASVTSCVTDSNGKTQIISKTSNGQSISANVDSKFGPASTGATTDEKSGAVPSIPFPCTGVDASMTATTTDSNGGTNSISKTSNGQTTTTDQGLATSVPSAPSKDQSVTQN
ncbi:hypothetical protein P3T76_004677 [Phytophthora citrophthora]|uniref:Uncharacterized protein n=1 Tax=Phytophthora citrophthora TaxID=4793 RepID=A0AAD9LP70_9STRA|nr:hypothetical protein P3T76_004677 [Phytophthora citrophthora]